MGPGGGPINLSIPPRRFFPFFSFFFFCYPDRRTRNTVVDTRRSTIKVSAGKRVRGEQETRVHLEECVTGSATPISGNKVRCLAAGYRPCTVHTTDRGTQPSSPPPLSIKYDFLSRTTFSGQQIYIGYISFVNLHTSWNTVTFVRTRPTCTVAVKRESQRCVRCIRF